MVATKTQARPEKTTATPVAEPAPAPEPAAVLPIGASVAKDFAKLSTDISALGTECEGLVRMITQARKTTEGAAQAREAAFGLLDEHEVVEQARADAQTAHKQIVEASERLQAIVETVVPRLRARRADLSVQATSQLHAAGAARDRALRDISEWRLRSDQIDALASQITRACDLAQQVTR